MSPKAESSADAGSLSGSPCLQGERVAFTGTLASMTHQQAHDLVERHGGIATQNVSRQTTMLVVGEEGWPLEPDGHPSIKLQQATQLQQEGVPIRVICESDWLRLLGLEDRPREVHALYTPAMLSQLLKVRIGTIRRWERLGLIRPVRKVYRLPYFDFAEVASLRRLGELLEAGITRARLEASLGKLRTVLPALDRPLAQLNLLAQDARLLVRDDKGLVDPGTGQRCFDFDSSLADAAPAPPTLDARGEPTIDSRTHWSADQWFAEGCRLLDDHDAGGAIESFRLALMSRPGAPEINFHLAEALYRIENREGALERYYAAVEADQNYLEAWAQIGCIHAARGELASARDAFEIALSLHRDYPDAHWHLADVLMQLSLPEEAAAHWRAYLEFDSLGPWAEQAKQRLATIDVE